MLIMSLDRSGRSDELGDTTQDVGVLVEVVTGTDAVVSVCDDQGSTDCCLAADEQDGRKRLALHDPLQILGDFGVIGRQEGKLTERNRSLALRLIAARTT